MSKSGTTVIRNSKFRHVFGTVAQLRDCYGDIRLGTCSPESTVIKANSSFFAIPWAKPVGICIVPLEQKGAVNEETPLIFDDEDNEAVNELSLCPTDDQLLATAHNKGYAKIWRVPLTGLSSNLTQAEIHLTGHPKRLLNVDFHPLASHVLTTFAADYEVKLWDANSPSDAKLTVPKVHKGLVTSLAWNYDGSLFATSCKDKNLRVFDPRANSVVGEVADHQGAKSGRLLWTGRQEKILSIGFTKTSEREMALFDPRNIKTRLTSYKVDNSSSGPLAFYDDDTGVLFFSGKGDGNIRTFEITDDAPFFHSLTEFKSNQSTAGLAMLPKTSCQVMKCEIARMLKLTPTGQVLPIRWEVPRQNTDWFQDDLFPDTWDLKATMTSSQWFSGANTPRNLKSLKP